MITDRERREKIAKLRALAERPGTPHEGEVARAMIAKLEAQKPQASEPEYEGLKFAFGVGFDSTIFQQACRDAAGFGAAVANEFERREGVYERIFREQGDWHAQQRREADERQRRDAEDQRAKAEWGFIPQWNPAFKEEMKANGETMEHMFLRKKREWTAQQKAGKK